MEISFYLPTIMMLVYGLAVIMLFVFGWMLFAIWRMRSAINHISSRCDLFSDVLHSHRETMAVLSAPKKKAPTKKRAPKKNAKPVQSSSSEPPPSTGAGLSAQLDAIRNAPSDIVKPEDL